ncbi:MAG: hypothetical protein ACJ754_06265 [Pyrinomonadaceae bacterium]
MSGLLAHVGDLDLCRRVNILIVSDGYLVNWMAARRRVVKLESLETYRDIFDRLEREGVRYVGIGGAAVVLHGRARPVADLDLVIDPAPEECERALRALIRAGFVPSLPLPLSMLTVLRLFDRAGREVDLFVRYQIPFAELWAASERRCLGGVAARVMSLEHLLLTKRLDGRPRDLLDLDGLLALHAGGGPKEEPAE